MVSVHYSVIFLNIYNRLVYHLKPNMSFLTVSNLNKLIFPVLAHLFQTTSLCREFENGPGQNKLQPRRLVPLRTLFSSRCRHVVVQGTIA